MTQPSEKLAESLERLHALQKRGALAIRSADLTRIHRERLLQNGFLQEVIKGWYIPTHPDETVGESTTWYASFWQFCAAYLQHLKDKDWCLSPYVMRIRLMWQEMRERVIEQFPETPVLPKNTKDYLKRIEDIYVTDAYHSLSIEGYRVSPELIERVRSGTWNPDSNEDNRNALAARGYWQAYQAVRESIGKVLQEDNPGTVVDDDHRTWYRELFAPGVTAGLLHPADLAGYRNGPVYIRRSMHVPPNHEAVRDAIPAFFDLLREEMEPSVRIVLGYFIFVYIHPYMNGNGRMGRFLLNVMLASGGYPWTVVPMEERNAYMAALEDASVDQNIMPFTRFMARLVTDEINGKPEPGLP